MDPTTIIDNFVKETVRKYELVMGALLPWIEGRSPRNFAPLIRFPPTCGRGVNPIFQRSLRWYRTLCSESFDSVWLGWWSFITCLVIIRPAGIRSTPST